MNVKKLLIPIFAGLALSCAAGAQTSSSSQSNAASDTQASASSDQAKAQAQSNSSAAGSQQAAVARNKKDANASGSASNSTSASASVGPTSASLSSGTEINASLVSSLDAKRSKPGDRVVAVATQDVKQDGQIVLRKHTKLIGHVTQAQARAKDNAESSLGIAFDSAVMKDGKEEPFHAAIQAVAAAQSASSAAFGNDDIGGAASGAESAGMAGGARSGGLLGGAGATASGAAGAAGGVAGNVGRTANAGVGGVSNTAASAAGNAGGLNATGQLTSSSRGVFGLEGLNLSSAASSETQGSVLVSSKRNVHLSSGTQILLRAVKE